MLSVISRSEDEWNSLLSYLATLFSFAELRKVAVVVSVYLAVKSNYRLDNILRCFHHMEQNATTGSQRSQNKNFLTVQVGDTYMGADKTLARPGRKQSNVSVRMG